MGVDIGGSYTKVALVQQDGAILRTEQLPTGSHTGQAAYLNRLIGLLREMLAGSAGVKGIGLALPGLLTPDRHTITFNPNTPGLVGIDFYELLEPLGCPLAFEQDLNVPALAEYHLGAARGSRRLMSASIGTGLGAAVILDNELLRFSGNTVGDSGHIILDPEGPTCPVGCHGCGEALISAAAIERSALQRLDDPRSERLKAAMTGNSIAARDVINACQDGDPLAVEIITDTGNWLGQWLASLAPIFIPDTIVLCGGISEAGEPLRTAAEQRFRSLAGPEYTQCEISLGIFKGMAGVIGAAIPFLLEKE